MKKLSKKDREFIFHRLDDGGIDYAMRYSVFSDIKNKKFHELREAYLKAVADMEEFLDYDINRDL